MYRTFVVLSIPYLGFTYNYTYHHTYNCIFQFPIQGSVNWGDCPRLVISITFNSLFRVPNFNLLRVKFGCFKLTTSFNSLFRVHQALLVHSRLPFKQLSIPYLGFCQSSHNPLQLPSKIFQFPIQGSKWLIEPLVYTLN